MFYIDSNTYIYFDKNASQALTSKLLSIDSANSTKAGELVLGGRLIRSALQRFIK